MCQSNEQQEPVLRIFEIADLPTVLSGNKLHESLFRSYHILIVVEKLLEHNTPSNVVLALLREMCMVDELMENEPIK